MITTETQSKLLQDCLMYFLKSDDTFMSKQNRALLFVDTWNRIRPQRIVSRYTFRGIVVTITKATSGKYSTVFQMFSWSDIRNEMFDSIEHAQSSAEKMISVFAEAIGS